MYVTSFQIKNFRNIAQMQIEPCEGINVIYGDNAQGKTSLIEAMWIMSGCKSFRGSRDQEMIAFSNEKAELKMNYVEKKYENEIEAEIGKKRVYVINGGTPHNRSDVIGEVKAVAFSPVHLNLVKNGPNERRRFLDSAISQVKPNYKRALSIFSRAMEQRNAILVDAQFHKEKHDMLCVLEEQMAEVASYVATNRLGFVNELQLEMEKIFYNISDEKEKIELKYVQAFGSGKNFASYKEFVERLVVSRKGDVNLGSTSVGPHRDDIEILINGKSARKFASQGQQKTIALALKLSEANILERFIEEPPIILLDDVMSELDSKRQDFVLNQLGRRQMFITSCDDSITKNMTSGKYFKICEGKIISEGMI